MKRQERTFVRPHVLVVEGKDDFGFLVGLLDQMNVTTVQIMEIGGYPNLRDRLELFTKTPGFQNVQRLGCVDIRGDNAAPTC
jgi:hypothetical protein